MNIARSIAASGLAAAALHLRVSASDVANALSFGPLPTAKNTAGFPPAYIPLIGTVLPSYVPIYDPTAPYADNSWIVAAPNTDLGSQLIEQMLARYTIAANGNIVSTNSRMMNSLLDITA
jgi:flagellar basal-body rod protein FlgC